MAGSNAMNSLFFVGSTAPASISECWNSLSKFLLANKYIVGAVVSQRLNSTLSRPKASYSHRKNRKQFRFK